MGYRSEVILAVTKEIMPQFLVTMAKCPEARTLCFQEADDRIDDYQGKGNMLFKWDDIKWYAGNVGYEDIDAVEDFMDWCDGEDHYDDYRFVRVGEDSQDVVHRGSAFDIYTETRVTY